MATYASYKTLQQTTLDNSIALKLGPGAGNKYGWSTDP